MSENRDDPAPARAFSSLREQARSVYGSDTEQYAAGRPAYPPDVFSTLRNRCGLRDAALVLEIGPGTGLVTRHLLDSGARVIAVEPDPAMARYLNVKAPEAEILRTSFEDANLGSDKFDLAVSATAFHWVDQAVGIPKLARALRPGGWAATWWTIFDDPDREDLFRDELERNFGEADPGAQRNVQFQLDSENRRSDLVHPGDFVDVTSEVIHWTATMDPAQLQALYGSMMAVRRRPVEERNQLVGIVADLAKKEFGGIVRRSFTTVLYTARKSDGNAV